MPDRYFVFWQDKFSVQIDSIDQEHKILVGLIRKLQEAMWEGRGRDFQKLLIDKLVAYTSTHFSHEEELLRTQGYADLEDHVRQHQKLALQVQDLRLKIYSGEAVSSPQPCPKVPVTGWMSVLGRSFRGYSTW